MRDAAGAGLGPRVERVGDAALLLVLGDLLDLATGARARRIASALDERRRSTPGLGHAAAGHGSVLLAFDPDAVAEPIVRELIAEVAAATAHGSSTEPEGILHELRVRYGGSEGPDLPEIARRTRLDGDEVIRLHASVEYRVMVVGFVPGFPYLAGLPAALELPRRATARVRVPAGSVAITGRQCGIYPFATSGGWHVIGRTEAALWDPRRDAPALLAPGDRVRFVPA